MKFKHKKGSYIWINVRTGKLITLDLRSNRFMNFQEELKAKYTGKSDYEFVGNL